MIVMDARAVFQVVVVLVAACWTSVGARKAVCNIRPDPNSAEQVMGTVTFTQASSSDEINIEVNLKGFDPVLANAPASERQHGFHVHTYGDTTGGCASCGGHYNPDGVNHAGPNDAVRHPGDFGNLNQNPDGTMTVNFKDRMATLFGDKSILGRSIVVHGGVDDLGKGGNAGSLANGNAGPRVGCCVIGWAEDQTNGNGNNDDGNAARPVAAPGTSGIVIAFLGVWISYFVFVRTF